MENIINYINSVELVNDKYYIIEHNYTCQTKQKSVISKKIKIPKEIIDSNDSPVCANHDNYFCEFNECIIIKAAREWLINSKKEPEKPIIEKLREELPEAFEIIKEVNLPEQIKEWLCEIIVNNKHTHNWNLAIWDSSDTFFNISKYQDKIIEVYLKLLEIKTNKNYKKVKYINCINLIEQDLFKNIDSDVYIFSNIYGLIPSYEIAEDYKKVIQYDYQLNLTRYILDNISHNKVFILCDKFANGKLFFNNFTQLNSLFKEIQVINLSEIEISDYLIKELTEVGFNINNKETQELQRYIEDEWQYSPYKNYDLIYYILQIINGNHLNLNQFPRFNTSKDGIKIELDKLVGLENIKSEIEDLKNYLIFRKEKESVGDKVPTLDLHMAFLGNPGTGKTTVARLMSRILFNLGFIRYNKCLEIEAKDLISEGIITTSTKTSNIIQKALGGVLFIDEAYSIMESKHGAECIATLIKAMEDYREDLVVILAGYNDEMNKFLSINSGFDSRISYKLKFEDYTIDELLLISENLLEEYGMAFDGFNTKEKLKDYYMLKKRSLQKNFGNSRFVRNTIDKILRQHAKNTKIYIDTKIDEEINLRRNTITSDDIKEF